MLNSIIIFGGPKVINVFMFFNSILIGMSTFHDEISPWLESFVIVIS